MSGLALPLPDGFLDELADRVAQRLADRTRPSPEPREYLTVDEAADYIRAPSRQRIYDLRSMGRLGRYGDGRKALVRRSELDAYLTSEGGRS
jgi:excisionase family DNA binding protein